MTTLQRFCRVGLFVVSVLTASQSFAQSSLALNDQLPPYLLSAVLLNNGHFAVSTGYSGTPKTLIYREDGTGNRPVNYTSHIHVRVDNVLFQLPFESDLTTDAPPPPNPLRLMRMFRDTVLRRPRINYEMAAIMPTSGDSVRVTFTMEPVKRPSGGFIRISVSALNRGGANHDVGVLMLIDTKIGDNDQAPIPTAFGFSGVETSYSRQTTPGMPEFWLALEGTPISPGLAARGNLRASDLLEPDVFLFGNWVDDPTNNIPGLYRVQWKERIASGLTYTDSAILMIWDQNPLLRGQRKLLASTEIGVVDSLIVTNGTGGGGGGGGGGSLGVAGAGSCLSIEAIKEDTCGRAGYRPYDPDTLQTLYLVTNTGKTDLTNVRVEVGAVPPGLQVVKAPSSVIPSALLQDATGVATLSFALSPRLATTSYQVPIAFVSGVRDTIIKENVCITVPGLLAAITVRDVTSPPICPTTRDTIGIPIDLKGFRCRRIDSAFVITAGGLVRVLQPYPVLPADGRGLLLCEIAPTAQGSFPVQVRVVVRDEESLLPGDTTWVSLVDTIQVTVIGKLAELKAVLPADTLDLGTVCINDTSFDDLLVQNVGGCAADIIGARFVNNAGGIFAISPSALVPQTIARAQRGRLAIEGRGLRVGLAVGTLELTTPAVPGIILVQVKLRVDVPTYASSVDTIDLDTICPGTDIRDGLLVTNATACAVDIDSIDVLGPDSLTSSPTNGFTISARGRVGIAIAAFPRVDGPFLSTLRIRSAVAGDRDVVVRGTAATRSLSVPPTISFGDVRVGTSQVSRLTVTNSGTAPVTIRSVNIGGANASEYSSAVVGGPLPRTLAPAGSLDIDVTSSPLNIEARRATISVVTEQPLCTTVQPIAVTTRGIQPLLDVVTREVIGGRRCVGAPYDTVIVMRNVGNAPLNITNIVWSQPWVTTITNAVPFQLDSGEATSLPIRVDPRAIGPNTATCTITMDGDWLTPSDTLIQLASAGLLCATMYVDTMVADVGTRPLIDVRLIADERTQVQGLSLLQIIDAYGGKRTLSLRADASLMLFGTTVSGALTGATAVAGAGSVTIDHQGAMVQSPILASIPADVMLSVASRTPVDITVIDFVDGYHDLRVEPGLLIASYCAKDQRLVQSTAGPIVWSQNGDVVISSVFSSSYRVAIYTLDGRCVLDHSSTIGSGETVKITVPHYSSGMAYAVVTTPRGVTTLPFVFSN
ncbi:MAG: choice-of-anchor D domain-containing protein [Candidatus Kapabacteria bacterium]|nr:choice-of-anchor D domain-containing protein [Candidatus Kapabacteria bacterium]